MLSAASLPAGRTFIILEHYPKLDRYWALVVMEGGVISGTDVFIEDINDAVKVITSASECGVAALREQAIAAVNAAQIKVFAGLGTSEFMAAVWQLINAYDKHPVGWHFAALKCQARTASCYFSYDLNSATLPALPEPVFKRDARLVEIINDVALIAFDGRRYLVQVDDKLEGYKVSRIDKNTVRLTHAHTKKPLTLPFFDLSGVKYPQGNTVDNSVPLFHPFPDAVPGSAAIHPHQ